MVALDGSFPKVGGWEIVHAGLTADMYVIRDRHFLTLKRAGGLGSGFVYIPGGVVEPGEDPAEAAVRETLEESGLSVVDQQLLRVWTWPTPEGWFTVHATFIARCERGDVVLSDEHTSSRWVTPDAYIQRWCSEEMEAAFPGNAGFLRQVRLNTELVASHLRASTGP